MGLAFVFFLSVFRLTVTVGTISGLIFYANIIGTNENAFYPKGHQMVFSVFIAWIKLNLGIETCFTDELDMYTKTWLQFVFPIIIHVGNSIAHYSVPEKKLLVHIEEKFHPYEVLSYRMERSCTLSFQWHHAYTTLQYTNDTAEVVWLYDANIKFLQGKHIPLFVVSVIFLFVLVLFTLLLLFGQCIKKLLTKVACLRWIKKPVDDIYYYAPYEKSHQYWPGLLLVIWLVLLVVFGAGALHNNDENLLAISAATFGLLAWP